ncbi:MAG TPA: hypothetical protein VNT53_08065 [Pseudolysinimonas sp.]|nr:hypothetical protein [Pseudolysinimonas sp.]
MEHLTRVGLVGVGRQGAEIAEYLIRAGYQLTGAVAGGANIGRPLVELVPTAPSDIVICGTIDELLASGVPDIVVHSASTDVPTTIAQAAQLMGRGVNFVTIHEGLFDPDPVATDELDRLGRSTGASFLSTGVQDTWWVHLPELLTGSSVNVREISIVALIDADTLPRVVGTHLGIGLTAEQFVDQVAADLESSDSVLEVPLREAARRLGLELRSTTKSSEPVFGREDVEWTAGGEIVPAGRVFGATQFLTIETTAGIVLSGQLSTRLLHGGEEAGDDYTVRGDPDLSVHVAPFPGAQVASAVPVARIPDVIAAPGGVLRASSLPVARFRTGL